MGHLLYDYSRLLVETLQLWHDAEFAKQVNKEVYRLVQHSDGAFKY